MINNKIAEFLGWHLGDGCISITKKHREYALTGDIKEELQFYQEIIVPTLNDLFKNLLIKPIILKKYSSIGVCGVYIFNKKFIEYLIKEFNLNPGKKINIEVPKLLKTDEQKKSFLRGLFDTDGSIYFCKSNYKTKTFSFYSAFHYKPKIKLATISKPLIEQVFQMLTKMGFNPRTYKPIKQRKQDNIMYCVVLDTKSDTKKWITEIGFKSSKHLTKIQIWQKFGFCPAKTTLSQRNEILLESLNPLIFYPNYQNLILTEIKPKLGNWHQF